MITICRRVVGPLGRAREALSNRGRSRIIGGRPPPVGVTRAGPEPDPAHCQDPTRTFRRRTCRLPVRVDVEVTAAIYRLINPDLNVVRARDGVPPLADEHAFDRTRAVSAHEPRRRLRIASCTTSRTTRTPRRRRCLERPGPARGRRRRAPPRPRPHREAGGAANIRHRRPCRRGVACLRGAAMAYAMPPT